MDRTAPRRCRPQRDTEEGSTVTRVVGAGARGRAGLRRVGARGEGAARCISGAAVPLWCRDTVESGGVAADVTRAREHGTVATRRRFAARAGVSGRVSGTVRRRVREGGCPPPSVLVGFAVCARPTPPSSVPVAESRGQPATFRLFSFALKVAARIYGLSLQVRAWRSPDRRSCEDAETGERVTASYSRSALRVHRTAGQRLARSETQ